jgi:hypothetical protein
MYNPRDAGTTATYISMAPSTTALFFELNPEMQGPITGLCAELGRHFPGCRISMTAVFSYRLMDLQMVVGVSAPMTPENARLVDALMQERFQPVMDRMKSKQLVVMALGDNLGEHSARDRQSFEKPVAALADMDYDRERLVQAGAFGRLLATSAPLFEQGQGDDLARLFKVVSKGVQHAPN